MSASRHVHVLGWAIKPGSAAKEPPARSGGAQGFRARVTFGCHTFTKDVGPDDDPAHHYQDGGATRCFCPIRYGHSNMLPGLFRSAATGGSTHFSSDNKMLLLSNEHGTVGPYMPAYPRAILIGLDVLSNAVLGGRPYQTLSCRIGESIIENGWAARLPLSRSFIRHCLASVHEAIV